MPFNGKLFNQVSSFLREQKNIKEMPQKSCTIESQQILIIITKMIKDFCAVSNRVKCKKNFRQWILVTLKK
jgi:hypothetical protein